MIAKIRHRTRTAVVVRCYVCGQRVPKEFTWLARHRVPSGAVNTRSAFTYRMVRKCNPNCDPTPGASCAPKPARPLRAAPTGGLATRQVR